MLVELIGWEQGSGDDAVVVRMLRLWCVMLSIQKANEVVALIAGLQGDPFDNFSIIGFMFDVDHDNIAGGTF